ncbi:MAG: 3-mercaptopyruvate sulfurtransferase [Phyllobacterium sp.]
MTETSAHVVSFDWLQANLGKPGLSIVDASWYLPVHNRDPRVEYAAGHVPGAVFFDHDRVVDPTSKLPHTLPLPHLFAEYASSMGITAKDTIVVYDGPGMSSAPRVWWMFRIMGAKNVFVLDGGFDQWKAEGRPVSHGVTQIAPSAFIVDFKKDAVARFDEMLDIVKTGSSQIADARSRGRFTGEQPEPRAGMRSGHMPGARSVPIATLSENGHLKDLAGLREALVSAGIDLGKPVVTSCGSGVTAAVIALALHSVGHTDNRLYDGSWSEWGGRSDTPVVTGEP